MVSKASPMMLRTFCDTWGIFAGSASLSQSRPAFLELSLNLEPQSCYTPEQSGSILCGYNA